MLSDTVYTRGKNHKVDLEICGLLWNDFGFSLYAMLSVCHIVITSDEGKKSKIGVSTDWYVAIEHQKLSSIRVIFVDYQTSKLQCNYYSYIQGYTIGDAQGFSGIALSSKQRFQW